jgi:hypothetical protein
MDIQDLTKIKQLINTAPILSAPEKGEWLVLIDLMDEKQLKELEKILTSPSKIAKLLNVQPVKPVDVKPPVIQKAPVIPPAPINKPEPEKVLPVVKPLDSSKPIASLAQAPKIPQMPKLSHIMNVPKAGGAQADQIKNLLSQTKINAPIGISPASLVRKLLNKSTPTLVVKKEIDFRKKLDKTVHEKELPAAKEVLEFPKPPVPKPKSLLAIAPPQVIAPVKSVIVPPVAEKKPIPSLPKISLPISTPVKLPEVKSPLAASAAPKPFLPLKPLPKMATQLKPLADLKTGPAFTPGLNIQRGTTKTTQDTLDNIKQHLQTKASIAVSTPPKAVVDQNIPMASLKDLIQLNASAIEIWDLDLMVSKIRSLIGQFGYFDVIFSIEKSELYKVYIDTGLKMLTAQVDFEQLSLKMKPGEFLEKKEFEKFTDLLSMIQAS